MSPLDPKLNTHPAALPQGLRLRWRELRPVPAPLAQEEADGQWLCAENAEGRLLAGLHLQPELGRSRPRLLLHVGRVVHAAPEFGLHQVQSTLQLGNDASGEAELSGLYLAPELLDQPAGDALLDALLGAALQQLAGTGCKAQFVVVELPGWRDAEDRSPIWDGLLRPFLPADASQPEAQQTLRARLGPALSTHLGAMLPRQTLHVAFLPDATQQALGRVAPAFSAWQRALVRAGFADWRHVRLEDGGPVYARPFP